LRSQKKPQSRQFRDSRATCSVVVKRIVSNVMSDKRSTIIQSYMTGLNTSIVHPEVA
jgi:hypothetical protein